MTLRDLKLRIRALLAPRRVENELDEELAFHVEAETAKLVAQGHRPAEARRMALARFGSVALAADECRDARGIAFVDNLVRDVVYALRTFLRAPLPALTIIGTLSLGLGMVAVAFSFYNALVFRTDAVSNPEELYQVNRPPSPRSPDIWMAFTQPQFEMLGRQTDAFTGLTAVLPGVDVRIDSRTMDGALVTANFFDVLNVQAALGRRFVADEDQPVLVLSHRAWNRIFDADSGVVGRTVRLNGSPFGVIGVMPEAFRGLELVTPDYWIPLSQLAEIRPSDRGREDEIQLPYVIGRLRPDTTPAAATAQLTAWAAGNDDLPASRGEPKTIRLIPRQGTVFTDAVDGLVSFAPLFLVFGLVLLIGCANVANLLLARAVTRQREIGIRLSLGASRARVVRQLVTESLLLALAAAVGGLLVSRLFLEGAMRAAVSMADPRTAEVISLATVSADWRVLAFLLGAAALSTLTFAVVPALRATRLELVQAVRGDVLNGARPGLARHALITIQVGASALLLVTAAVFLRGAFETALATTDIRVAETIFVDSVSEPLRQSVTQAASDHPAVTAVAAMFPRGIRGNNADATTLETGPDQEIGTSDAVSLKLVSPGYFDLVGLELLNGRGFAADEQFPSAGVVVVSELMTARLWPGEEAVGRRVRLEPWAPVGSRSGDGAPDPTPPPGTYTVIGVVPHVQVGIGNFSMYTSMAYLPTSAGEPGTSLTLRVRGDSEQARQQLSERLAELDPGIGNIWTLAGSASRGASILRAGFWMTAALGALALLLTTSGVFGVISYLVEQRRREIGVRMALGARAGNVLRLVLFQSLRPVAAGLVVGGALAGTLVTALLALPAAARTGEVVRVYDPLSYSASILCIAVFCVLAALVPAWRAARIDPLSTLRSE